MTQSKPQTFPSYRLPSDKTNVQKTWRAHGWKPSKKQPARGTGPVYAREGGRTT